MAHTLGRSSLSAVSTGTSIAAEEALETVEVRPSAAPDALREAAVEVRADRAEARAGIVSVQEVQDGAEELFYS